MRHSDLDDPLALPSISTMRIISLQSECHDIWPIYSWSLEDEYYNDFGERMTFPLFPVKYLNIRTQHQDMLAQPHRGAGLMDADA